MKRGKTLVELATEIERRANAKKDLVASTEHIQMYIEENKDLAIGVGDKFSFGVNSIAHEQIAAHNDIPKRYYDRMAKDAPALLVNNVNEWFKKYPSDRMVRTLDGKARAFLSNSYRPLENEDLANAVLPVLMDLGLDIMSSEITESRLYIKAVDPKVTRELQAIGGNFGDGAHKIVRCLAPAITISNSEVGRGALSVLGGVYDGFCSNLASFGERSARKYHTGAKHALGGEEIYSLLSSETRKKTDAATWAQISDVVKAAFDRARFDSLCNKIAETQEHKIEGDPVKVVKLATSEFGLNDGDGASILRHLIEGGSLTRFGLYNAVTRAAQDVEDYDKASAMERNGAQIIELPANEWKVMAMAA
jgi:hypothetical protein